MIFLLLLLIVYFYDILLLLLIVYFYDIFIIIVNSIFL